MRNLTLRTCRMSPGVGTVMGTYLGTPLAVYGGCLRGEEGRTTKKQDKYDILRISTLSVHRVIPGDIRGDIGGDIPGDTRCR